MTTASLPTNGKEFMLPKECLIGLRGSFMDKMRIRHIATSKMPTKYGEAKAFAFQVSESSTEHIALQFGEAGNNCLVRVHSECLTGEALHSLRCDCGDQLNEAFELISENGGLLIYLRNQEGRGIGLGNKIKAYSLQDTGLNTIEANHQLGFPTDQRDFKVSAHILKFFDISSVQLLTNSPLKMKSLMAEGIEITQRVATRSRLNEHNQKYLKTKANEMGHLFKEEADYL